MNDPIWSNFFLTTDKSPVFIKSIKYLLQKREPVPYIKKLQGKNRIREICPRDLKLRRGYILYSEIEIREKIRSGNIEPYRPTIVFFL